MIQPTAHWIKTYISWTFRGEINSTYISCLVMNDIYEFYGHQNIMGTLQIY